MPKLTKSVVDSAAPGEAPYYVWDSEIRGFGLQVFSTGVKSFVLQYRAPVGRRSRRGSLGRFGEAFTAEDARRKARQWRRMLEDGIDPLGAKQAAREALTVADVLDAWMASARFKERAKLTQDYDKGRVERHLKPLLGRTYMHELRPEDVRKAFASVAGGKTACNEKGDKPRSRIKVTGGEGAARMAIRVLRAAINWAIGEGLASNNPAASVAIGSDGRRRVSLTAKDYKRLFEALADLETKRQLRAPVCDAIRLIALTGARRNEIAALRWQYVNLKAALITLPPGAHKAGKRTGEERRIGLPAAARAILQRQPAGEPGDLVFPPAKGESVVSLSQPWRVVRVKAKLPAGMGLHGLRHALASHMAVSGAQAAEIMTTLGHKQLSTSQSYIDFAKDERAKLAERAASRVSAALVGKPKRKAKVVSLAARRASK